MASQSFKIDGLYAERRHQMIARDVAQVVSTSVQVAAAAAGSKKLFSTTASLIVAPGAMALTLIPNDPSSRARQRVKATIAPFELT